MDQGGTVVTEYITKEIIDRVEQRCAAPPVSREQPATRFLMILVAHDFWSYLQVCVMRNRGSTLELMSS